MGNHLAFLIFVILVPFYSELSPLHFVAFTTRLRPSRSNFSLPHIRRASTIASKFLRWRRHALREQLAEALALPRRLSQLDASL